MATVSQARRPVGPVRAVRTCVVALAAAALAGCTAIVGEQDRATFALPETETVECQEHQELEPTSAYAGDEDSDTVAMLDLLRYWTANGDKPYCDGEPPTETDLMWAKTVERLQGGVSAPTG